MKIKNMIKWVLGLLILFLILVIFKYLKLFDLLMLVFNIFIPVFIGFIYAWFLNPLLSKYKHRNCISVGIFFFIIILLFLFLYYLVPLIYKEINELVKLLPNLYKYLEPRLLDIGININDLEIDINKLIEYVPNMIISLFKNCFKYIWTIFVGLIMGLYMSIEYDNIVIFFKRIIPDKYKCEVVGIMDKISEEVRKCFVGMFIIALFIFITDTIGFYVLGLNSPILLGTLCGITDLIPYIGPYIGGGIAILVALSEGNKVILGTLIFLLIIQCIENYILQPFIMSKSVKISPLLIIIGLLVFGNLFGIIGMIASTPLVCVIKVFYLYIDDIREKCK